MKATIFYMICFGVNCFIIGAYCASEIKFDTPIETYRWIITGFCVLIFLVATITKVKEISKSEIEKRIFE